MVRKTNAQLRREIAALKKIDKVKEVKLRKSAEEEREKRELENELKELRRSDAYKKLRSFSRAKLNKEKIMAGGKASVGTAKTVYKTIGIVVNRLIEGMPSEKAGLEAPFVIYSISGIDIIDPESFVEATEIFKPDKIVKFVTNKGSFEFKAKEHHDNSSKGYVGITDFSLSLQIKQKFSYLGRLPYFVLWFNKLIFWLFVVNLGVGLFNLLPLGIVDGGRMFYLAMLGIFKDERLAKKLWTFASLFLLLIILINLFPYLMKLFLFLGNLG